jgi:hypothetical protein
MKNEERLTLKEITLTILTIIIIHILTITSASFL